MVGAVNTHQNEVGAVNTHQNKVGAVNAHQKLLTVWDGASGMPRHNAHFAYAINEMKNAITAATVNATSSIMCGI